MLRVIRNPFPIPSLLFNGYECDRRGRCSAATVSTRELEHLSLKCEYVKDVPKERAVCRRLVESHRPCSGILGTYAATTFELP